MQRRTSRSILAENIRAQRLLLGLTQVQLAQRLGAEQSYVARLEGGDRAASIDRLDDIAEALECSSADLLTADKFSTVAT